jgi:tetratricopeptide (TPR) repeat protein
MSDQPRPARILALFPFALASKPVAARDADLCRGFACFLERQFARLTGLETALQNVFVAPESDPERRGWLMTNSLWTMEQLQHLPFPPRAEISHILQGQATWQSDHFEVTMELVDLSLGIPIVRETAAGTPEEGMRGFFRILGMAAEALMESPSAGRLMARAPTKSVEAFENHLLALAAQQAFQQEMVDAEPALACFLRALEADPNLRDACELMENLCGICSERGGKNAELALNALNKALELGVPYPRFRALLGIRLAERAEDRERALELLKGYVQQEPAGVLASRALRAAARIHSARRDARQARQLLLAATHADPDDPAAWEELGACHDKAGDHRQAEVCWRRALQEDPDRIEPLVSLAGAFMGRCEWEQARMLLERAVLLPGARQRAVPLFVEVSLRLDNLVEADVYATQWAEEDADNFHAWLALFDVRLRVGEPAAARYCLGRAEHLGRAVAERGALALRRFALESPGEHESFQAIASALKRTNATPILRQHAVQLRILAQRFADVPAVLEAHVEAAVPCGLLDEAIRSQRGLVLLYGEEMQRRTRLIELLVAAGRLEDALVECDTALRSAPMYVILSEKRGDILAGLGRNGEAAHVYTSLLLSNTPESGRIRTKLVSLEPSAVSARPLTERREEPGPGFLQRLARWLRRG